MFTLVFSSPLFANSFKHFQSCAICPGDWWPLFVSMPAKTAAVPVPGPGTWLPVKGPALTPSTSPPLWHHCPGDAAPCRGVAVRASALQRLLARANPLGATPQRVSGCIGARVDLGLAGVRAAARRSWLRAAGWSFPLCTKPLRFQPWRGERDGARVGCQQPCRTGHQDNFSPGVGCGRMDAHHHAAGRG